MESVGKSSLIEAFLKMPINYTAEGRATFAPILYRVRKNVSLGDEIKCTVQFDNNTLAKLVDPDQLSVVIRDHMSSIREHQGVSTTPLIVTLESGHASTRNITIVDTPGKIRTDIEGDRERSKTTLESIAGIVDTVISEGPDDVIVLVENGAASPGSIDTFKTTVQTHDPHLDRTLPVCTHFDSKFTTDYGSTKSATDHFQSWKHVFDKNLPFWVALHNLPSEKRRELGFEGARQEIIAQLSQNEKFTEAWLGEFVPSLPTEVTARMGLHATVDAIQELLNVQFLKKSKSIISVFDDFRRAYEQELEMHSISTAMEPGMSENPISGIITDFVNKFVRFYVSSFRGIMPGQYGNRKVQDIFKNGFSLADEHRAIASNGEVDPWPKQGLRDDEYAKYVTNAREKLASGAQRLDRLKCELGVRIMSVEPEEPSDESILNLIGRDFGKDILDLNQAVTQLVRLTGNQLFVSSGCQYIGSRAQLILVSHADLVLAMLTSEYPALLSNQVFVSEFKNAVYEVFNGLADEFSENIKKQVISTTSSIRMGRPTETEQAFRFLYGFDANNTLGITPTWRDQGKKSKKAQREREQKEKEKEKEKEREREKAKDKGKSNAAPAKKKEDYRKPDSDSDEDSDEDADSDDSDAAQEASDRRMTREERMRAITKIRVTRDDQIENPRTGKIKSWQYDQARYVFRRQFSLLRLQYWLVVESALHGDVQEKILGPPGIQNLDQLLLQRLLLHETKKSRLSEPELNERYHWREQLEIHKQSINVSPIFSFTFSLFIYSYNFLFYFIFHYLFILTIFLIPKDPNRRGHFPCKLFPLPLPILIISPPSSFFFLFFYIWGTGSLARKNSLVTTLRVKSHTKMYGKLCYDFFYA
eukprot:Phypoly_transcript_01368.p1 GENE.Phypoly_transcript_01368~~Phypoly_transcript_01368.p1  ORF type:complete len:977 (+),score=143.15 Phypoly_transcript_01368:315-2933(+)